MDMSSRPKMSVLIDESLDVDLNLLIGLKLAGHWDNKLSQTFALAPIDLAERGLVNAQNYREQNTQYGRSVGEYVNSEIDILANERQRIPARIAIWGIGKCREWDWFVSQANQKGIGFDAFDWSRVACSNARLFFKELPRSIYPFQNTVTRINIRKFCRSREWELMHKAMVFAFAFFQVQPIDEAQDIMKAHRAFFQNGGRMIIVHPFWEDNDKPVVWEGVQLPRPRWGDSKLHALKDLLAPLHGQVGVIREPKKVAYYHQIYTALTLGAV